MMNITIDDTSPQIRYYVEPRNAGGRMWYQGNTGTDAGKRFYSRQTFALTTGEGNKLQFTFNGSIAVYGSKWHNHGSYTAYIDNNEPQVFDGFATYRWFNYELFSAKLEGQHELTMTNRPSIQNVGSRIWFDIDHIVLTHDLENVYTTRVDDGHAAFTYQGDWMPDNNTEQGFYNLTSHTTMVTGDTVSLAFSGVSVQLFGTLDTSHRNYTITLDGVETQSYNATWHRMIPDMALYTASGLSDGPHVLTLTNEGGTSCIDYAVFNSTVRPVSASTPAVTSSSPTVSHSAGQSALPAAANPSLPSSLPAPAPPPTSESSSSGASAHVGAIVGGAIGVAALAGILGVVIWYLRRRLKQNEQQGQNPFVEPYSNSHSVYSGYMSEASRVTPDHGSRRTGPSDNGNGWGRRV